MTYLVDVFHRRVVCELYRYHSQLTTRTCGDVGGCPGCLEIHTKSMTLRGKGMYTKQVLVN